MNKKEMTKAKKRVHRSLDDAGKKVMERTYMLPTEKEIPQKEGLTGIEEIIREEDKRLMDSLTCASRTAEDEKLRKKVEARVCVTDLEEARYAFKYMPRCGVWGICGNEANYLSSVKHAEEFFDIEARAYHQQSPATIGELKRSIARMKDDLIVFRFAYGNQDGYSEWKRKETWKQ